MSGAIGWKNWLEEATTLTASGEAQGFEVANIIDWRTFTAWQGVALTQTIIEATLQTNRRANAWGIFGHNFTDQAANIAVEYHDGLNWQPFSPTVVTPITGCYFRKQDPHTSNRWRLVVTTTADPAIVTHWILCETLDTRSQKAPFSPAKWKNRSRFQTHITENGQFAGRTYRSQSYQTSMGYDILVRSDVDANYMPFVESAELYPFYYSWDIDNYPDDAAYCWTRNGRPPEPSYYHSAGYIRLNANLEARIE